MQGFENMLKMMGINPQEMLAQAQAVIDQFEQRRAAEHKALIAEFQGLSAKLDSMDAAIKSLDKDYVPDEFKAGDLISAPAEVPPVTNPDTPDGGAVDMSTLDPEKLAEMETGEQPQAASQDDGETSPKGGKKAKGG